MPIEKVTPMPENITPTPTQKKLFIFIYIYIEAEGMSPSYEEMKDYMELKSKSNIHNLIIKLLERGLLTKATHKARTVQATEYGHEYFTKLQSNNPISADDILSKHKMQRKAIEERSKEKVSLRPINGTPIFDEANIIALPKMGKIAAGTPIEAIRDETESLYIPSNMVRSSATHYALEVEGDSMIEVGINNGDIVIIRDQDTANNGDIVVALVDGEEATLKKYHRRGATIALEAANSTYETQFYSEERVKIQGKLVGLTRTY